METEIDAIFGIEPEGFIRGSSLAYNLGKGFVPVRKKGKLPSTTLAIQAEGEVLEVHEDAIKPGTNVLLVGNSGQKMDAVQQALIAKGMHVIRSE